MTKMIKELKPEKLSDIKHLVQEYIEHISDSLFPASHVDRQMTWYRSGLDNGLLYILCVYSESNTALGFLVHNLKHNRTEVIYANQNFLIEKQLFDSMFKSYSPKAPTILFESGYPTPWISDELSAYAVSIGFFKYDRQYMRLERSSKILPVDLGTGFSLIQCSESMLESVSELVFKSVDGTDDQVLFPYVYGTYESILKFHHEVIGGDFGIHKPTYSWILMKDKTLIGSCFMTTRNGDTAYLMHLAIDPMFRKQRFGRLLLNYSIINMYHVEPNVTGVELAVTTRNPARVLYESIGFKKVNDSATYVWTKEL